VDPHTGTAPAGLVSVTVAGPSLLWADVLATAVFARGEASVEGLTWLRGYQAILVTADRRMVCSKGMRLQRG
jgi:thiamine biosynthesis lipoprotein